MSQGCCLYAEEWVHFKVVAFLKETTKKRPDIVKTVSVRQELAGSKKMSFKDSEYPGLNDRGETVQDVDIYRKEKGLKKRVSAQCIDRGCCQKQ